MKVTLIDYTGSGHYPRYAAELLIFTKNTRLEMSPGVMGIIQGWPDSKITEELQYMANTIPSSWEFCDYTFMIEGVTRAFTHQFVRNRHGSYAQQTMRILDVSGFKYATGPSIVDSHELSGAYDATMSVLQNMYKELINHGAAIEDARGILPTNIKTNIVAKFNLRTLSEIVTKRSSNRTQAEYREVLDGMYEAVVEVHPWCSVFLKSRKYEAAQKLQDFITDCNIPQTQQIELLKAIDALRV